MECLYLDLPGQGAALESSPLPQIHLFEFHDLDRYPESFRNAITEVLRVMCLRLRVHCVIRPVLETVLDATNCSRIVDLCSGAGGPILPIQQEMQKCGRAVSVTLTDKFPNRDAFARAEAITAGGVKGYRESVDATAVPRDLKGVRTIFNAFHHFRPEQARKILEDAYRQKQPIAIFEITDRAVVRTLFNFPLSFLTLWALLPQMKSRRFEWWIFTYLLPLLPLSFGWDALISCLRSYTGAEFGKLKEGLEDESFSWFSGRLNVPRSPCHINYFVGIPNRC
jgi:hypothetical protein